MSVLDQKMKLFKVSDDLYLGFYSEYGGTVTITGSKSGKPVYSFAGASDEYRMLEHIRPTRIHRYAYADLDQLKLRTTSTGALSLVYAEFVGIAKSVGANEFVV